MRGLTVVAVVCAGLVASGSAQAASWSPTQAASPDGFASPAVAVDRNGNIAVASTGNTLAVSTRAPGGQFSAPVALLGSSDSPAGSFGPQDAQLGLSDNGYLAVGAFTLDPQGGHFEVFVRYPDGHFGPHEALPADHGRRFWKIAVGADGTIAVATLAGQAWEVRTRSPGDTSFGAPEVVHSEDPVGSGAYSGGAPGLFVDDAGGVSLLWATEGDNGFEYADRAPGMAHFTHGSFGEATYIPLPFAGSPKGAVAALVRTGPFGPPGPETRLLVREAGSTAWRSKTLPGDAGWAGVGVNDSGDAVAAGNAAAAPYAVRTYAWTHEGAVSEATRPTTSQAARGSPRVGVSSAGDAALAWQAGDPGPWDLHVFDGLVTATLPAGAGSLENVETRAPPIVRDQVLAAAPGGQAALAWTQSPSDFRGSCVQVAVWESVAAQAPSVPCAAVPAPTPYPGFVKPPRITDADARAPVVRLGGTTRQRLSAKGLAVTGSCASPCRLTAGGTLSVGMTARTYRLRGVSTRLLPAHRRVTLRLRLRARDYVRVRRYLRRKGARATARVKVVAKSRTGRARTQRRTLRLLAPRH